MQLKVPGDGSSPTLTMDLRRVGGLPKIQVVFDGDIVVGPIGLNPLLDRWLNTSLAFTIGDRPEVRSPGRCRRAQHIGQRDEDRCRHWVGDRVRPKWGIYRLPGDTPGSLEDCSLLLANKRGDYRKS
jgi:hypothetical protein